MKFEDVDVSARRQFLLDVGLEEETEETGRIVLNKAKVLMLEGRRIYSDGGDVFRLIVHGSDGYILCRADMHEWVRDYFGTRAPEHMLNFHNLIQLDLRLKEAGFMIEEVQECFLPGWELFEYDEDDPEAAGFIYELGEEDIRLVYEEDIFPHALPGLDKDIIALGVRMEDGGYSALAGAQKDGRYLWQIGVDVLPEYRGNGLAVELVHRLAKKLLQEDRLPFYGVRQGNIVSKKVAIAAGFEPAFSEVYVCRRCEDA